MATVNSRVIQIRDLGVRLSFVPEDRLGMGLVGSMGMVDNMMLKSYSEGHSFRRELPISLRDFGEPLEKLRIVPEKLSKADDLLHIMNDE